ncbi:MAG: hypothetical protein JJE18_04260 [Eubacteriaceae bacterium]|nr:hypothetical protein [Eubacteriaceae bacterium]
MLYLKYRGLGKSRVIDYIDSTLLRVCHIKKNKIRYSKTYQKKGDLLCGGSLVLKLHIIELLSFDLTKGNIQLMTAMTKKVFGKLFGDKDYISKALSKLLFQDSIL